MSSYIINEYILYIIIKPENINRSLLHVVICFLSIQCHTMPHIFIPQHAMPFRNSNPAQHNMPLYIYKLLDQTYICGESIKPIHIYAIHVTYIHCINPYVTTPTVIVWFWKHFHDGRQWINYTLCLSTEYYWFIVSHLVVGQIGASGAGSDTHQISYLN